MSGSFQRIGNAGGRFSLMDPSKMLFFPISTPFARIAGEEYLISAGGLALLQVT
jgi:hypothetical protein